MTGPRSILLPSRTRLVPLPLGAALALTLAPAGLAAQPRTGAPYPYVSVHEVFLDNVLIGSDGVLVGLQAAAAGDALPPDQLIVHLPAARADSLCVSILSIDGRYEGTFQFAARRMPRGPVLVDVRSPRYSRERAAYAPERLAVHASLADSCSSGSATLVVAGRTAAPPAALRLSLNADPSMRVRAEVASPGAPPGAAPIRCPLVDELNPFTFNRACTVPLPPGGPYELRVTLQTPPSGPRRLHYPLGLP